MLLYIFMSRKAFFFPPVERSSMEHNVRQGDRAEEECKNKVKLQSQADPGNTSAVTSDDNHQVLSEQRVERKSNSGKWRLDSDETLISDEGTLESRTSTGHVSVWLYRGS